MKPLTRSLAKTLKAIKPYDGDEAFMSELYEKHSPIDGFTPRHLLHDIADLEKAGMLTTFKYDGVVECFDLTADGRDYRWNRNVELLKSAIKYASNLLVGASGGLVVWLLTALLSAE